MVLSSAKNLKNVTNGMTDAELEHACEAKFTGSAQWVYWTSEVYGFGKCFRSWTKYPKALPLFVEADHGVGLVSQLFPRDFESQTKVYFTWHPIKEQRYKNYFPNKKVIRIIHPWIPYRRLQGITRSERPQGTLVFFTHSTTEVKWEGHDTEEYFEQLRGLPDRFQPVVLCLHMHDIKAGLHKELRCHGFPIVTAGNSLSTDFMDRFYDLVKDYAYATSQTWGSQVAYCVELGVPYFFLGERPELFNISDKNLPEGVAPQYWDAYHEEYAKKAEALFRVPVDRVTDEQREFVESLLGFDSRLTRWQVSWILWREFFRNWRQWRTFRDPVLAAFIPNIGLMRMINKILDLSMRKIIRRLQPRPPTLPTPRNSALPMIELLKKCNVTDEQLSQRFVDFQISGECAALDLGSGPKPKNPFNANRLYGADIRANESCNVVYADLVNGKMPFENESFQYVTAYDVLEHIPRVAVNENKSVFPFVLVMNEVFRVLKPGGIFFNIQPCYPSKQAFQDPTHVNIMTEDTLELYFCERAWARIYGYEGTFSLLEDGWMDEKYYSFLRKTHDLPIKDLDFIQK